MLLLTALATMLVAAAAVPLLAPRLGRFTGYPLALVFLAVAGLLLTQADEILDNGTVQEVWRWVPSFGVELVLRLDGLSLLFAVLVLGVGALIMSYAPQYLEDGDDHARLFGLLTLFAGAMLGLVMAGDVVLLAVFWELTTLCSFLLIAGRGRAGARPATRALVVTGGGGLALLGAVVVLSLAVGTTNLDTILTEGRAALDGPTAFAVGALLVVAAFTKSAQIPLHFWLPDAMVAITPVSAYLHAATLVKAGIYLLLRFSPLFADDPAWHLTLISFGLATMVVGALLALRQHDLKALLAYSTVSQLGLIVALVGVGTTAALGAAALHTAAHALFKATLFMLVGIIDREAGSRDIRELSGLRRVMPVTAALTGLAALSMAGVPPLVGFVSKEEAFYAFLGAPEAAWTGGAAWTGPVMAGVATLGAALTVAYSLRIVAGALFGEVRQPDLYEPSPLFLAPAAVPAVIGLALGLAPWLLNPIVNRTVVDTRFQEGEADLALWHGLSPALALSVVALGMGLVLHLLRERVDHLLPALPEAPRGALVFDRGWDAALALGGRVGRPTRTDAPPVHLAGAGAVLLALAGTAVLVLPTPPPQVGEVAAGSDWVVLALLLPSAVGLALMRSVVGAVMLLGTTGFVLAVWLLLLGAPDVALTLLLVEILTVVVAVPVLRGLPSVLPPHRRRPAAAAAAAALGLAAGAGVFALTGRRELSDAADYLLREGEAATGGSNVVNTVLVDFRGLDTFGELVVLGAAALGLFVLLRAVPAPAEGADRPRAGERGAAEVRVYRVTARLVLPVVVIAAAVLFWRGHDLPGGGFIAGLVAGLGVAMARTAGFTLPLPGAVRLVGAGLGVAAGTGLLALLLEGSFLRPVYLGVPGVGYELLSSLVFDLGVVLVVLGLVVAALDRLGSVDPSPVPTDEPEPATLEVTR